MCIQAEALRLRARNVALRFSSSHNEETRALARAIERAYLALAANEEWLAGAVHPYALREVVPPLVAWARG